MSRATDAADRQGPTELKETERIEGRAGAARPRPVRRRHGRPEGDDLRAVGQAAARAGWRPSAPRRSPCWR